MTASELVKKCCCKLFRILQIEYIIYKRDIKKCIASALNIALVSSAEIFSTTIEYGTSHRVSTQTSYSSGFFHIPFVDGWQEQVMPLDVHVMDKALSV